MSLPWFRLYRELKDDPKIGLLNDQEFRVYIESLCWACEKGNGGGLGLTIENASWAFRRNVTETLQSLLLKRLVTQRDGGELFIPKWEERQKRSDTSNERVRKFRAKNSVTLQKPLLKRECNGVEENRGDKKRVENPYSPESRVALHHLNEKSGRHFRESESSLSVIQSRLDEEGVTIEGVRKMIDRQVLRWKGTEQEEYLRPETLFRKSKFDSYYAAKDLPVNQNGTNQSNHQQRPQQVDRSVGTLNAGRASEYEGLGRVVKAPTP